MRENFDRCFTDFILPDEGGFVIRSTEPGGAGNMGVSFQVFATWEVAHGNPHPTFVDLKAMLKVEASGIYRKLYADPLCFDALPSGIDYCVLDCGINDGVHGSTRMLRQALNLPDGRLDADVLAAVVAHDPTSLIESLCGLCLARKRGNVEWVTWGLGWTHRIEKRRKRALAMVGLVS